MIDRSARLGEQGIPYLLAAFSLPAIVGMLAQAIYNVVDRVFVGRALGPNGIAGITVALPFMLVLLAFGMLIGFGAAALVSLRLGEGQKDEAEQVLGNAVLLLAGVSVVITVVSLAAMEPLVRLFGASDTVLPYARDYLHIIALGTVFQVFGFGLNAVIRGEGNPRVAMLTLLIGVVLNVILAPVFIFGLRWGMRGAGLATVLSQAVSAVWVLAHFLGGKSVLRLHLRSLRVQWRVAALIVAIGSPPFLMQMAGSVMSSLLNNQLRVYGGDVAISVMGISFSVVMMIAMPIYGINQGAQPIVGYNYGAGKFDRVKKTLQTAVLAASTLTVAGFAVMMLFPAQVIQLFNRDDALLAMGCRAMRLTVIMLPLIGFQVISASYFQAVGRPMWAMFLMLSRQVLLLIPAILIMPRFLGLDGIWLAIPTADFFSSLLTGICFFLELRHLDERHAAAAGPAVISAGTPILIE